MRFLPTKIHGLLDYLVGIALIAAPNIFQFSQVGGAAVAVPRILGAGLIVYSIFTDYEWGIIRKIPMSYHLLVDYIAAGALVLSPFAFGFAEQGLNVWLPHVAVGLTVVAVVAVSKPGVAVPGVTKYELAS